MIKKFLIYWEKNLVDLLNYSWINKTTIKIFLNLFSCQVNIENNIYMKYVLSTMSTTARKIISANETLFCIQPPIYRYNKIQKLRKVKLNTLYQ